MKLKKRIEDRRFKRDFQPVFYIKMSIVRLVFQTSRNVKVV